jgi:multiple sugar transport system substrate-binding protein
MVAAGCGKKPAEEAKAAEAPAAPAPETAEVVTEEEAGAEAEEAEPEELDFMGDLVEKEAAGEVYLNAGFFTDKERTPVIKELVAQFEKENPNITVTLQLDAYAGFFDKIRTQIASETAPDVWYTDGVLLFEWAERGVLKDLTAWTRRDFNEEEYYAMDSVKDREARIWAIPHEFLTFGLFYNKDLFDKFGVEYPSQEPTWDEILEKAIRVTQDVDNDGILDTFGYEGHAGFANYIYQHGTTILDETKQKSLINTEPVIAAVSEWYDMQHKYKILPSQDVSQSIGGGLQLFMQGRLGMWLGIFHNVNMIKAEKPSLRYDVALPPKKVTRNCYYDANCFVITRTAPLAKQEAAWKLIKFFMRFDKQKYWAENVGLLPCHKQAAQDVIDEYEGNPEHVQVFLDVVPYLITFDLNGCWKEWIDAFFQPMGKLPLPNQNPREMCLEAHKRVQQVLDEYYKKER